MKFAATAMIAVVAVLHLYFLYLEMFRWDTPLGHRIFRMTPEQAAAMKKLAVNQGLYNGFLVAGLVYGLVLGEAGRNVEILFLMFVVAAGVLGALTVHKRVFWIQAAPAILALVFLWTT